MADIPGFPCNEFDFHFEEVGPALAGLIVRDRDGVPRAGVLPSRPDLVRASTGWMLDVAPHICVRVKDLGILLGGQDEESQVTLSPAPNANGRIDVVWTRPADIGAGEPNISVGVAEGIAGPVPVKPAIPAGAVELSHVLVSAGMSSAAQATITNTFPYSTTAGGVLPMRVPSELAGWNPMDGARAFTLSDRREHVRQGGQWRRVPIKTGGAVMIVPVANQGTTKRVDFPAGLFPQTPNMQVTANSAASTVKNASASSVSTSGADVVLVRENSVSTTVWWEATLW